MGLVRATFVTVWLGLGAGQQHQVSVAIWLGLGMGLVQAGGPHQVSVDNLAGGWVRVGDLCCNLAGGLARAAGPHQVSVTI